MERPRASAQGTTEGYAQEAGGNIGIAVVDPLQNWVLNDRWPSEYFEPDPGHQTKEESLERDSWLEGMMALPPIPEVQYIEINGFRYPQPIRKAPTSLRRKQSDASLTTSSDQEKRESKSTQYRNPRYVTILETKGSFLRDFDYKTPKTTTDLCRWLLAGEQNVPRDSLFRDDLFGRLCWKLQDRNEAMIIQDVTRLIVPSAMNLAIYGDTHLDGLTESVNEAWTGCIPVEGPRPQPDYAVGFDRSAFTDEQLEKLGPLIGSVFDTSFFVATYRMYFPFLTCEVKCGAAALDVADRQNAHSMMIAVRSVVELYRAVSRETELNREILAFSISHDHSVVRIYGHYAVTDHSKTTFYRHSIKEFGFRSEEGAQKWTAYKFTKNLYDIWMPIHFKRICSAIDKLPSINFQVSQGSEVQSEATGLSQEMGSLLSEPSEIGSALHMGKEHDELAPVIPQTVTPDTSVSREGGQGALKKAKKTHTTE